MNEDSNTLNNDFTKPEYEDIANHPHILNSEQEMTISRVERISDKALRILLGLVALYLISEVVPIVYLNKAVVDLSPVFALCTIFISILIQAFPFLMAGALISAAIQVLVPEERLVHFFPRNPALSILTAALAGFMVPLCDCAVVPVAARLVKKGVPVYSAVTFMLAAPFVNPVVIFATLAAFPLDHSVAIFRLILGLAVAILAGGSFLVIPATELLKADPAVCTCGHCGHDHVHENIDDARRSHSRWRRAASVFEHAGDEFFDVGRYLIAGALLSSIVQSFIPHDIMASLFACNWTVVLGMMLMAFALSVCSTADAFIARSFSGYIPLPGLMSFMVLGPMLDIKNLLMISGQFSPRFVIRIVITVSMMSFGLLLLYAIMIGR